MKTVNIHEAKTHLSHLLAMIERTRDSIIICKHGVPVAELSPVKHGKRIQVHPGLKDIEILYDPIEPTESEWDDI
jgi:prevent-host-death family protein